MTSTRETSAPSDPGFQKTKSHTASTEATNPFSSGVVERWLENEGKGAPTESEPLQEAQQTTMPAAPTQDRDGVAVQINYLETDQLLCRLLIVGEQGTLDVPGGEWIHVRRTGDTGAGEQHSAECLAVPQRQEDISCKIKSPIQCELFYDSRQDAVQVLNRSRTPIGIEPLALADGDRIQQPAEDTLVDPHDYSTTAPGPWRISSGDGLHSFQIIIFPPRHCLALVRLGSLSPLAGSKRDRGEAEDTRQTASASASRSASGTEIIKHLDSLTDVSEGQMVHVMTEDTMDYSLFRMRLLGKTSSAQVFQAKHSSYPGQVVVVKAFMYGDRYNAVDRGRLWKTEYSIHRKLRSSVIVELFGADARIEALIMQHIDARDLGSGRWCDYKGDKRFLGTRTDAVRVLADMSGALLHLREKKVLHNDIKPSNILFSEERGAVLIDFGLATLDGSPATTGGTPWYVAPEYLTENHRGAPAEIWALGVVTAYLLRYFPLPDSGRQVKSWLIRAVGQARYGLESPADVAMSTWLAVVDNIVQKLRTDDDGLSKVVLRMLEPEKTRITAKELVVAVQDMLEEPAG